MSKFHSCGKLLLSGEYLILRGARGLALPTSKGQSMTVDPAEQADCLTWSSYDSKGQIWFQGVLDLLDMEWKNQNDDITAERLTDLLEICAELNPDFSDRMAAKVTCHLEFPNNWGLGSSSTLINNLADWAKVDAFDLLENSFGGSGYDVAVAMEKRPLIYEKLADEPYHEEIEFNPSFKDQLWFVHLGVKKDTASAVAEFLVDEDAGFADIPAISRITESLAVCETLQQFEELIRLHNQIMSRVLHAESAEQRFTDFKGVTKYLGAWGGDFMLATGTEQEMSYFRNKGMETILSYSEMIAQ